MTPMPKNATGAWAHTHVTEVYDNGGNTIGMKCVDCGLEWEQEIPE